MSDLFTGLNPQQRQAVEHTTGPLLIVAGAGTGKTTVVTRRLAHLIESGAARADQILALTFTEKAASEMSERVDALLTGQSYFDMWISTFHAFGERILQDHALEIGLPNTFALLSETEQWIVLREHLDELELDYYRPKGNPTKFLRSLISHISRLKDENITVQQYADYAQELQLNVDAVPEAKPTPEHQAAIDEAKRVAELARAYRVYQQLLRDSDGLDFGDLIVEVIRLFKERPAILQQYRQQFRYILVDEFQDTNIAQYELISLLAAPDNNLTIVADDDQSIYHFRGAAMSNIVLFQKDHPDAVSISLTENYRSSQAILDLAYESIQHNNPDRLEAQLSINKHLQSNLPDNEQSATQIEHLHGATAAAESQLVIDKLLALKKNQPDLPWNECVLLVRANDTAEQFLPYLDRAGIPYQFQAAQGLFSQAIVLDALAALQLCDQYHESRALFRIFEYPGFAIPAADIMQITRYAQQAAQSIYETCLQIRTVSGLTESTIIQIEQIMQWLAQLADAARRKTVGEVLLAWLDMSGVLKYLTAVDTPERHADVLLLNQLFTHIDQFEKGSRDKSVRAFLASLNYIIESGSTGKLQLADQREDAVQIMSIHASKGLEFSYVFIVNLIDRRFPSTGRREAIPVPDALIKDILPTGDAHLQEERRLFYVAMTRAKMGLFFTSAEDYGGARKRKLSRFLLELGFGDSVPHPTGDVLFQPTSITPRQTVFTPTPSSVFSFTQLMAYDTCPWQYRFAFLLKIPTPGKGSFSFGKTIHQTLYEFFRRLKEGSELTQASLFGEAPAPVATPGLDDLLAIYEKCWIAEWYDSKRDRQDYYEKGKQALEKFYTLHIGNWPEVLFLEKSFKVSLDKYTLKGAIDRIDTIGDPDTGAVEILDYKTGNIPKTGKKDMKQLYLYALAVQQVFQLDPVKLSYYFIESNQVITEEVKPKKLEAVSTWVLSIIEKILEGNFTPTPGRQCQYCDFKTICEYKQ